MGNADNLQIMSGDHHNYREEEMFHRGERDTRHARKISLMDGNEEGLSHHRQHRYCAFQPIRVPAVTPPRYSGKCNVNTDRYEDTALYRGVYDEKYYPRQRVETPPPYRTIDGHEGKQAWSSPTGGWSPRVKNFTQHPPTVNKPTLVHPRPSWNHQNQHYADHIDCDQYEQEQYWDPSSPPPHPNSHGVTYSASSTFRGIRGGNVHYSYTFDRHGALDRSHYDNNHHPDKDYEDADFNLSRAVSKSFSFSSPPSFEVGSSYDYPPRNIPNSTQGTDHKSPFLKMIEEVTRTPSLPKAASEVDFDVMKPPQDPVTEPSSEAVEKSTNDLNSYDVLLGRGGGTNSQIGNRHFRSLVQDFQPVYLTMKRKEKTLLARSIVLIVRKRGGRFLKRDDSGDYFEIGDKKAESKAAQALREGMEVRATTRKRKEILFQERELEIERRKVMRLSHSSREEHVYISEDQREMYPSRKFVYSSSIDEGKYNCRDNNSSHMCIDQQYNSSYPTSAFVSPMRNTARPSTKAPSDEKQLERRTIAHSFDDDEQEGIVPIEENDFLRYVFAA